MNWLEQPDRGEIHIGGQRLGIDEQRGRAMSHRQLAKIRERVGMVFQSFNLWPHLTVQQNVSEALLHVKGMKRDEAKAICHAAAGESGHGAQSRCLPDHSLRRAEAAGGDRPFAGDVARSYFSSMNRRRRWIRSWLMRCWGVMKALAAEGYTMVVVTHEMDFARRYPTRWCFWRRGC